MKQYVIIKFGKTAYSLKEKYGEGFFGFSLYNSRNLQEVIDYARENSFNIIAIGEYWEVV